MSKSNMALKDLLKWLNLVRVRLCHYVSTSCWPIAWQLLLLTRRVLSIFPVLFQHQRY